METILLSVKPEYAERILDGSKRHEYRKRISRAPVNKIIIYATVPVMKVVGEVQVVGVLSGSPTSLWEQTKTSAGISRAKYRSYFRACKSAYAYQLGEVLAYTEQKSLADYGITHPPQSFIYINEDDELSAP